MTGGPLADVLAAVMIGVTCFHAGRLTLAKLWRRPTQVDVDIVHTAMGVSMAGMLTGWVTGAWNDLWIVAFAASTVWFGRSLVRRLSDTRATTGLAVAHHLPHFVASGVMLYMLWAMRWMSMTGGQMVQMGPAGAIGSVSHAVGGSLFLPSIVAALVVGNAAIAAWMALSPSVGLAAPAEMATLASAPIIAPGAAVAPPGAAVAAVAAPGASVPQQARMLGARGAPACLVAMSVGMAYMVVAVHP